MNAETKEELIIKGKEYSLKLNNGTVEEENFSRKADVYVRLQKENKEKHGVSALSLKKKLIEKLGSIPFSESDKNIYIPENRKIHQKIISKPRISRSEVIKIIRGFIKKRRYLKNMESGFQTYGFIKEIKNSRGSFIKKENYFEAVYFFAAVEKNGITQTASSFAQKDFLTPQDIKKCLKTAWQDALNLTKPQKLKSGRYKAVFTPAAFLNLFQAFIFNFNGENIHAGKTYITKKAISKKMFSSKLSLIDDKKFDYDDEGFKKGKTFLVKEGKILTFLTDYDYALKLNLKNTANSLKTVSGPRVSSARIYIKPSNLPLKRLYKKIKDGILITKVQMGSGLNEKTGALSCGIDGAVIKNGSPAGAFSNCGMRDNLFEIMKNVIVVSKETEFYGDTGLPYVAAENISVTGN